MTSSKTSREAPVRNFPSREGKFFPAQRELPIWAQWLIFITALLYAIAALWFLA